MEILKRMILLIKIGIFSMYMSFKFLLVVSVYWLITGNSTLEWLNACNKQADEFFKYNKLDK
jgi:hypothetical protein